MPSDAFAYQQQGYHHAPHPDKLIGATVKGGGCPDGSNAIGPGGPNSVGYTTLGQINGDGSAMSYSAMGGGCTKMTLEPVKLLSNGLPQNYVGPAGSFTTPPANLGGGKGCPSRGMYDLGVGVL